MNSDVEQLRLLAIFHYVLAGITALFSLFPIIHLMAGIGMITGQLGDNNTAIGWLAGWLFVIFSGAFIVGGLVFSACLIASARFLKERRRYLFCFVTGAVACVFFPFGTAVGVFTLVVLSRGSVKALFEQTPLAAG